MCVCARAHSSHVLVLYLYRLCVYIRRRISVYVSLSFCVYVACFPASKHVASYPYCYTQIFLACLSLYVSLPVRPTVSVSVYRCVRRSRLVETPKSTTRRGKTILSQRPSVSAPSVQQSFQPFMHSSIHPYVHPFVQQSIHSSVH